MNLKKRLEKLEHRFVGHVITVKLQGGGAVTLPAKRVLDTSWTFSATAIRGEIRIALAADSSNSMEKGYGRMIELTQALSDSPRTSSRLAAMAPESEGAVNQKFGRFPDRGWHEHQESTL